MMISPMTTSATFHVGHPSSTSSHGRAGGSGGGGESASGVFGGTRGGGALGGGGALNGGNSGGGGAAGGNGGGEIRSLRTRPYPTYAPVSSMLRPIAKAASSTGLRSRAFSRSETGRILFSICPTQVPCTTGTSLLAEDSTCTPDTTTASISAVKDM